MATAKDWLRKRREEKEAERVANSMSKENLLSAVGSLHERRNKDTVGYKSLSDTWKDLYKRATDYYNNEAYKGYADAYNGMVGNERYVGKNDAGRWYRDLEKQKNTANEGVDELLRELDQYSRYYNEDAVNYVRDLITQRQKSYDDVMTAAGKFRDHWSQWETEDDYNNAVWESDFYSKLQSGDFDGAVKMHQEKLDALKLSPTEEGMAKLSEYGEYLAAAKNNALINKYQGKTANELLKAKDELGAAIQANASNDPLGAKKSANEELIREFQYVEYLLAKDDPEAQAAWAEQEAAEKKRQEVENAPEWQRWLSTGSDVINRGLYGISQGVENVNDFLGRTFVDLADTATKAWADTVKLTGAEYDDSDYQKWRENYLKGLDYDWAQDTHRINKDYATVEDLSYFAESPELQEFLYGVAEGVGQMAPAIGLGAATGGTSFGAYLPAIYQTLSAAGSATEEALEKDTELGKALRYGLAVGALEGGSEFIGGSVFGEATNLASTDFGKWLTKIGADKYVGKGLGKAAYTFASEGVEESIMDIATPLAQSAFDIGNSRDEYFGENWKEGWRDVISGIPKTFVVGGTVGAVIEGFHSGASAIANKDKGGFKYNKIADEMTIIENALKAEAAVKQSKNATPEKNDAFSAGTSEKISASVQSISETMQKLTPTQRAKVFADASILETFFNEDGSVKQSFIEEFNAKKDIAQIDKARKRADKETIENKLASRIKRTGNEELISSLAESITKAVRGEKVSNAELRRISQNEAALRVLRNALKASFDIKSGVSVSDLRNAITSKQSSSARLSSENILSTYSAVYDMDEAAERSLMVNYATDVKNAENGKAINPEDYAAVYGLVYAAGKKGVDVSKFSADAAKVLSPNAMAQAYKAGQNAAKVDSQADLQSGENSGIINKNAKEAQNEQGVHLRDSGERHRGKNTQGQIPGMEGYAGQDQSRGESGARPRDSEAASLTYDREVSAKSLGIKNGLAAGKVRLVAEGSETASMKEAKRIAAERGLNVIFFGGGNLKIKSETGNKIINARAYIQGNNVYIRADHAKYTADQLMRHEAGHDMINKGEVNVADVRARIEKNFTPEEIDAISKAYAIAYADTGLTTDEIWEEVICDSLADMNVFEGRNEASAEMAADFLPELKEATLESKKESRGPPKAQEGKASRDTKDKPRYIKITDQVHRSLLWELRDVYGDVKTAIADEVAVALGNTVYIVDSGRENGRITCWAIDKIVIEDQALRKEYIRRKNYDALSKGYISDGLSARFRNKYAGDRQSNRRQQIRPNLQTNNGKSTDNQSGIPKENADNGGLKGKASIDLSSMDSEYMSAVERGDMETAQRMVEEAAEKAMPNSKIRDESGNLLLVYHGSPSKFTVFEHNKMNVHGNAHGRGFYFTENKSLAEGYEKEGGQLLQGYLNIENPLSEEKVTIKRNDLVRLVKATCLEQAKQFVADGEYSNVSEAIRDTWISNYVNTYNMNINDAYREVANIIYSSAESDVDIIAELTNGGAGKANTLKLTHDILGYDGVIYTHPDGTTHEYVSLISNQFKSAEPITYDDSGNVIPLSERFNSEDADIRFSYDLESMDEDITASEDVTELSDRERLAAMLESNDMSPSQKGMLTKYKNSLSKIEANEAEIIRLTEELDALKKNGKGNTAKSAVLENKIRTLEKQNAVSEGIILNIEAAKPIKRLLERERRAAYQEGLLAGQMAQGKDTAPKLRKTEEELATQKQKSKTDLAEYKRLAAQREGEALLAGQMAQGRKDAEILRKTEEELAATKQKSKDELAKLRQKRKDDLDALAKRYLESRAKSVEQRRKTDIRNKIKEFKDKLQNTLKHPTDRKYIPGALAQAMIDVCELIDTDTELYKADGTVNKAQEKRNETRERLAVLREQYKEIKKNADPLYEQEYDEQVAEYLEQLENKFKGKSLSEMSLSELSEMYGYLRSIDETLRNARKLIGEKEAADAYEAGDKIIEEQRSIAAKRKKGERGAIKKLDDGISNQSLSPVRRVLEISGYDENSPLYKLFQSFERGVRSSEFFKMQAIKSFDPLTSGKKNAAIYEKAVYEADGGDIYTDVNGRKFGISKMQKMQAVLSYERESANKKTHHIDKGGLVFADLKSLRDGNIRAATSSEKSHKVSADSAVKLIEKFKQELAGDGWAQEYMAAARVFFNETAKNAINDTYMKLKHRILATENAYIPFEVDQASIVREISAKYDIQKTISSYGMLQDVQSGSANPLIMTGLNNILDRHIDQVGTIYGLAVPIRNFNKVWNVKSVDGTTNVREQIEKTSGRGAIKVIEQTVQDIQGERIRSDGYEPITRAYKKVKSNYIGMQFWWNASVMLKQLGSMFSSTSKIRYRGPVRMLGNFFATIANRKKIAAEVDKYTASAWMRGQGLSDAEIKTLSTEKKRGWLGKIIQSGSKGMIYMDQTVALSLWKYCKQDVAKKTGLRGEELLKATAEYYDEVIETTQSMSDVLHRPEIQRSGGIGTELAGTFKTDLYQNAGNLRTAIGQFANNTTKENATKLAKAVGAVMSSAMWGSIVTSLIAMLRYKVNRYRDEEDDELTTESWLEVQGMDLLEELVGYIIPLGGSEAFEAVRGFNDGKSFGNVIASAIPYDAVNDLYSDIAGLYQKLTSGKDLTRSDYNNLIRDCGNVLGIPTANIMRVVQAVKLHGEDILNGEFLSFEAGLENTNDYRLYKAMIEGNADKIDKASRNYKNQEAINKAIRAQLRERDSRVREAAAALVNGDIREYEKIFNDIYEEDVFKFEDIREAIFSEESYYNSKLKEAATANLDGKSEEYESILDEIFDRYESVLDDDKILKDFDKMYKVVSDGQDAVEEAESAFKVKHINVAFDFGDDEQAFKILDELMLNKIDYYVEKARAKAEKAGKTFDESAAIEEAEKDAESSIQSSLTSYWKPKYITAYNSDDTEEMNRIEEILSSIVWEEKPFYDDIDKTLKQWGQSE